MEISFSDDVASMKAKGGRVNLLGVKGGEREVLESGEERCGQCKQQPFNKAGVSMPGLGSGRKDRRPLMGASARVRATAPPNSPWPAGFTGANTGPSSTVPKGAGAKVPVGAVQATVASHAPGRMPARQAASNLQTYLQTTGVAGSLPCSTTVFGWCPYPLPTLAAASRFGRPQGRAWGFNIQGVSSHVLSANTQAFRGCHSTAPHGKATVQKS